MTRSIGGYGLTPSFANQTIAASNDAPPTAIVTIPIQRPASKPPRGGCICQRVTRYGMPTPIGVGTSSVKSNAATQGLTPLRSLIWDTARCFGRRWALLRVCLQMFVPPADDLPVIVVHIVYEIGRA